MSLTQAEALKLFQKKRTTLKGDRYNRFRVMSHDDIPPISFLEYYKNSTYIEMLQQSEEGDSPSSQSNSLVDYAMVDYAILTE